MLSEDIAERLEFASVETRIRPTDYISESGPFDLIGDAHGCHREVEELLVLLGYRRGSDQVYRHPQGRRAVFTGDLEDRGPDSPGVVSLVAAMVAADSGLAVMGNHDEKFLRCLSGGNVNLPPSAQLTLDQYNHLGVAVAVVEKSKAYKLLSRIPHHLVLDGGRLVVAHAGLPLQHHGQVYRNARKIAVYGRRERGADGVEIPYTNFAWEKHYSGQATVVQGHVTVSEVVPINRVWRIDTGCVFGGRLTALRYPEMEIISVPAHRNYWPTTKAGSHFPKGD